MNSSRETRFTHRNWTTLQTFLQDQVSSFIATAHQHVTWITHDWPNGSGIICYMLPKTQVQPPTNKVLNSSAQILGTMTSNIRESLVWIFLHVMLLGPQILRWLPDFWKIHIPLAWLTLKSQPREPYLLNSCVDLNVQTWNTLGHQNIIFKITE